MQPDKIKKLTDAALNVGQGVLQVEARKVSENFQKILTLFSKCHNTYSRASPMTDAEIDQFSEYPEPNDISCAHFCTSNTVILDINA